MKLSFETIKYYKKNKRISKTQGILFMALGFVILGFVVYGLFQFAIKVNAIHEDWNSDDYSSDYSYDYQNYDCSAGSSATSKMNEAYSSYDIKKIDYELIKNKYYSTDNLDTKLDYHSQWGDAFNSIIFIFNDIIFAYNEDPLYFDNCYNYSASLDIESIRAYLDNEEIIIDTEFQKLKPLAEAEGYIFYE